MSALRFKKAGASDMKLAPTWWRRMDSNHRRQSQQIYSLSPLATWVLLRIQLGGKKVELVDGFEPPTC